MSVREEQMRQSKPGKRKRVGEREGESENDSERERARKGKKSR